MSTEPISTPARSADFDGADFRLERSPATSTGAGFRLERSPATSTRADFRLERSPATSAVAALRQRDARVEPPAGDRSHGSTHGGAPSRSSVLPSADRHLAWRASCGKWPDSVDRRTANLLMELSPMDRAAIERVAANSSPTRVPVEGDSSLEERHWTVRLSVDLPRDHRGPKLEPMASEAATSAVRGARLARGLDADADEGRVTLQLHSVDARHLIVSIGTVRLERDDAHAWIVAASAALRALHDVVPIEDIQGLPRAFWKVLVGS